MGLPEPERSGEQRLTAGIAVFEVQHRRLVNTLNIGHLLARPAQEEVFAVGRDVRDCCLLLADMYPTALAEFAAEMREMDAIHPRPPLRESLEWSEEQWRAWYELHPPDWEWQRRFTEPVQSGRNWSSRISVAYKTTFFFTRAYQDALCRVLLVTEGLRAGGYSSMNQVLKKAGNPISRLVDRDLPGYRSWFRQWTRLRDQLKRGVALSLQVRESELGVVFRTTTGDAYEESIVSLSDVAGALTMSANLAEVTVARVTVGWERDELETVERLD